MNNQLPVCYTHPCAEPKCIAKFIAQNSDKTGGYYLYTVRDDDTWPLGDSWHQSMDDAKHQAEYENGGRAVDWLEFPDDVAASDEAVAFLRARFGP